MTPDDHAELIRLRDRIHAIADNTTIALGHLRDELHQIGKEVAVVAARIQGHTEQHQSDVRRLESLISQQTHDCERQFEEQAEDVKALRRGVYTLAFSAVGAALVFALSVFSLVAH